MAKTILESIHGSSHEILPFGGNFVAKSTTHKIIRTRYYWPSIFHDYFEFVRSCDICQCLADKQQFSVMPLKLVLATSPFEKWGLDFIGPINPPSSARRIFILTTTNYFSKWSEAIALKNAREEQVINFLQETIFSRFGLPVSIIIDNAPTFISTIFLKFCVDLNIKHSFSSSYYPQGNGLSESTNKQLIRILKKIIEDKPCQ